MGRVIVLEPPLDELSRQATPYPAFLLDSAETGLCLFAAGFLGINDAIHMARNDLTVTCVDVDAYKLEQMAAVYPVWWEFYTADAWDYAKAAEGRRQKWDVVSVDTFLGDATKKSLSSLDLWCSIANKAVTATVKDADPEIPEGWQAEKFPRGYRADWLVLTRA